MNGAVGKRDNVTRAAAGTMRVVGPLVPPESGKVRVRVAVEAVGIIRVEDEAFVGSSVEVFGNPLECIFVGSLGVEGVAGTLVDGEGDVGTSVTRNIEKHANNAGVVKETRGRRAVGVFGERGRLGGCFDARGVLLGNAASVNDLLDEARLGQGGFVAVSCNVDAEEAFSSVFTA